MIVASLIAIILAFAMGTVVGLLWGPKLLQKKYNDIFEVYKKQLHLELEHTRSLQNKIVEDYKQTVQNELSNYLLNTAIPPNNKEEMN